MLVYLLYFVVGNISIKMISKSYYMYSFALILCYMQFLNNKMSGFYLEVCFVIASYQLIKGLNEM